MSLRFTTNFTDDFFQWAWNTGVFAHVKSIRSAPDVRNFCSRVRCDWWDTCETCCIWHVSVRSLDLKSSSGVPSNNGCPFGTLDGTGFAYHAQHDGSGWIVQLPGFQQLGTYAIYAQVHVGQLQLILLATTTIHETSFVTNESSMLMESSVTVNNNSRNSLTSAEIASIVLAVLIVSATIAGSMVAISHCRNRARLHPVETKEPERFLLDSDQINFFNPDENNDTKMSRVLLSSKPSNVHIAIIKDMVVAVKKGVANRVELTSELMQELQTLRNFKHPNLVEFVGISLDSTNMHLYWEYCQKGSLGSIIRRLALPLNWTFRLSILSDIAAGLSFLHERSIIHGRLSSNNCVVDGNWTCKITDFGMDSLRFETEYEKVKKFLDKFDNIPYVAMEYRERPDLYLVPEMDIYSFGTLMSEIALRTDFHTEVGDAISPLAYQAALPDAKCFEEQSSYDVGTAPKSEEYCDLMQMCWQSSLTRPTANYVHSRLIEMNPRKISPTDLMMIIVNEYSTRLENLVEERTEALRTERQLTDRLLHSMLPKGVVEALRVGQNVPPEAFDQCTIYFSDIVGFTTISSQSTPFEVVALLNKLYSEFDEIIDRYDVYKVETIGDAYMVASGVPRRNGERHAIAVTDMSLDLVNVSHHFVIPHMPQEPLKIRVGLHSGPVCAGVVGLKMPRYCLFGDTVNTASRMESTGEAYKIHCSDATHDILERLGGFVFERRGTIEVKGKGVMQTWWVLNRMREEVEHDVCPLPANWKRRVKKAVKQKQEMMLADDQQTPSHSNSDSNNNTTE